MLEEWFDNYKFANFRKKKGYPLFDCPVLPELIMSYSQSVYTYFKHCFDRPPARPFAGQRGEAGESTQAGWASPSLRRLR